MPSMSAPTGHYFANKNESSEDMSCDVASQEQQPIAVAITGHSFRFPGGLRTPDSFWDVLNSGRCVTEEMPSTRWNLSQFYSEEERTPGRFNSRKFGLVENADTFDAAFFNISAADAEAMDPQQRVFLMCVAEALESSCIPAASLRGSDTGVFVGTSVMEYLAAQTGCPSHFTAHTNPGVCLCVIANRVSFYLGLRGPSMAVDTACASTLTALDLACRAIRDRRCNIAIVGGCNNLLLPEITVGYAHMGVLASDGRCKSFDAAADGYARAEGYGCVVLRRWDHTVRAGCPVLALVRGSGCSANGDQTTGLTKPSLDAQADLIRRTWAESGLDLGLVDYVEAHGTGTAVGDPIEANAIGRTLGAARRRAGRGPLPIGSTKANLGHMEPAAALAGLVKACLIIQHRTLPPQALFENPHPDIDWVDGHITVLRQSQTLAPDPSHPLTIALNSFGFGGSNAHAILQAPPPPPPPHDVHRLDPAPWSGMAGPNGTGQHIGPVSESPVGAWRFGVPGPVGYDVCVPLTAASADALRLLAGKWKSYCCREHNADAVAATVALKRTRHAHRLVIIASSAQEFSSQADKFVNTTDDAVLVHGKAGATPPRLCVVFSGQGPQHRDMGRWLYVNQPVFRDTIEQCDRLYSQAAGESFLARTGLFRPGIVCTAAMDRPDTAQPAVCFYQIAVFALLASWSIHPHVIVGHSVGEVAAAWAAGRLSLANTIRLIYTRAQIQQSCDGHGAMIAVACSRERVEAILEARGLSGLSIAAINSPSGVAVAGVPEQVTELKNLCHSVYGLQAAVLGVRCAYHSPHMDPLRDSLLAGLAFLDSPQVQSPVTDSSNSCNNNGNSSNSSVYNVAAEAAVSSAPDASPILFSSVTGEPVDAMGAEYWWHNVRQEVRFQQAITAITASQHTRPDVIIEISCRNVLGSLIRQTLGSASCSNQCASMGITSTGERGIPESRQLFVTAAQCFVRGVAVHWSHILGSGGLPLADLPSYPFREDRFMKIAPHYDRHRAGVTSDCFLNSGMELGLAEYPWVAHHTVGGNIVVPGAAFVEMMLETMALPTPATPASREVVGGGAAISMCVLEDVCLERAAVLGSESSQLRFRVVTGPGGRLDIVQTGKDGAEIRHCNAKLPLSARTSDTGAAGAILSNAAVERGFAPMTFLGLCRLSTLRQALASQWRESRTADQQNMLDSVPNSFTEMPPALVYKTLQDMGYTFGPSFRVIEQLWRGDEEAIYTVAVPPHLLGPAFRFHPILLDACIHGCVAALGSWSTTVMPVHIAYLEIGPLPPPGLCFRLVVHACVVSRTGNDMLLDVDVCLCAGDIAPAFNTTPSAHESSSQCSPSLFEADDRLGPRIVVLRGLQLSSMVKAATATSPPHDALWQLTWQSVASPLGSLTASLTVPPSLQEDLVPMTTNADGLSSPSLGTTPPAVAQAIHVYATELSRTADVPALHALAQAHLGLQGWIGAFCQAALHGRGMQMPGRYRDSVQRLASLGQADHNDSASSPSLLDQIDTIAQKESLLRAALPFFAVELDIVRAVGLHMCDILARPSTIADVIYRPELLPQFFCNSFTVNSTYQACSAAVASMAEAVCKQGRVVRILEVGVRTGGLARHIARCLQPWAAQGLVEYIVTDLATTFLAEASAALAEFPWVKVRRFNIEMDAMGQGLVPGFDVVVVFSTLHGVASVPAALAQLSAVLAPGGVLLNIEPAEPAYWWLMEMWFGSMEVWWRMADFRAEESYYRARQRAYATCWLESDEWIQALQCAGFENVTAAGSSAHSLLFRAQFACRPFDTRCFALPESKPELRTGPGFVLPAVRWPRALEAGTLLVFTGGKHTLDVAALREYASGCGMALAVHALHGADASATASSAMAALVAQPLTVIIYYGHLGLSNSSRHLPLFAAALTIVQCIATRPSAGFATKLLCVTKGSCGSAAENPLAAFLVGFSRTIAAEMPHLPVTYADLPSGNSMDYEDEAVLQEQYATVTAPSNSFDQPTSHAPPTTKRGATELKTPPGKNARLSEPSSAQLPATSTTHAARSFGVEGRSSRAADCTAALLHLLRGNAPGEGEVVCDSSATGQLTVPRLHRHLADPKASLSQSRHVTLEFDASQDPSVRLCAAPPPRNPKPDEIVIAVDLAGLNFKDVLVSHGLLKGLQRPSEQGDLGFGCVGRVTAVGMAVHRLAVGDTVVALASPCLRTSAVCNQALAARVDPAWGLQHDMLACITLYATAYEALTRSARVVAGETVLIHSAASGVGHCAVQLARAAGCVVYVTAGTEAKRALLHSMGLEFVSDSRCPAKFAADVRRWSGGRGVDVVLNCLAGSAQRVSLELCAPGARFVEIGKKDMLEGHLLSQRPLLELGAFMSVQLDLQAGHRPASITPLLEEVLQAMRTGLLQPISCQRVGLAQCAAAMQVASRGTALSKFVVDMSDVESSLSHPLCQRSLHGAGACLVVGGLGGIGLGVARLLALRGAANIVLVSRSAAQLSRRQRNDIAAVELLGARVHVLTCDVADEQAVQRLIAAVTGDLGLQLHAVVHLAATLADGLAVNLSPDQLCGPVQTKALGALHLHRATLAHQLAAFVVTTSTQDLLSVEQSGYVAANTICQQLVAMRRHQGLAGCAVSLGPVLGAGMVERAPQVARLLGLRGVDFISLTEAAATIVDAVCLPQAYPPYIICARIERVVIGDQAPVPPGHTKWLHLQRPATTSGAAGPVSAATCLSIARAKLAEIFCLSADDVDPAAPLLGLGVDSLVATELLAFFHARLHRAVSYTDILAGLSLNELLARTVVTE